MDQQLRGGLVNFIGTLISQSGFTGETARHSVVSTLTEESLKLTQNEEGVVNLYCAKPILRATVFILSQRIKMLEPLARDQNVNIKIKAYKNIVNELNSLIDSIKKGD